MNLSAQMPTTAFQPQMLTPAPMAQSPVMPSRGPMVPIFDFEDMERGMRFGR
jgi:hypothetical protein